MTLSPPGGYSNTRVTGCQLQLQLVTIATVLIILFGQVPPNSGQYSEEAPLACRAKYAKFNGNHTACLRPNGCKITHVSYYYHYYYYYNYCKSFKNAFSSFSSSSFSLFYY